MFFRKKMLVLISALGCCLLLTSCATSSSMSVAEQDFRHHRYAAAFEHLWWPAHHCNPRAQYALGYMYYYGYGTVLDQDLARIWFKRSADAGYCPAIKAYAKITNPEFPQYVPGRTPVPPLSVTYKSFKHSTKTKKLVHTSAPAKPVKPKSTTSPKSIKHKTTPVRVHSKVKKAGKRK